MCKIILLHLKNVPVNQFVLIQGTVFKNAVAGLFPTDCQDPQSGKKGTFSFEVGDVELELNKVKIIFFKSHVLKCHTAGADIYDRHFLSQKFNLNPLAVFKFISIGVSFVFGLVDNRISYLSLFFPEQIQPSCFVSGFLLMYWVPRA